MDCAAFDKNNPIRPSEIIMELLGYSLGASGHHLRLEISNYLQR
jgi:hypothetical protein